MITRTIGAFGLALSVAHGAVAAQNVPDAAALAANPEIKAALDAAKADVTITEDQIRFCEIAAPSFKEGRRAGALKLAFEQIGLSDVRTDKAGNVLGEWGHTLWSPRISIRYSPRAQASACVAPDLYLQDRPSATTAADSRRSSPSAVR